MELRKNPKIDLEKKRGMFLSVGLFMSLLFVFSAFEWKSYGARLVDGFDPIEEEFDIMLEIPNTIIPPPKPPVVHIPNVIEVEEEELIEEVTMIIDAEVGEDLVVPDLVFEDDLVVEEAEETFTIVETNPVPEGGLGSFYKFIGKQMKYPKQARKMGVEGKVYIQFVVGKDGSLNEIRTIKGIGAGCDAEAERVIALAPKWNPGKQRGVPVNVRMIVPVNFQLN